MLSRGSFVAELCLAFNRYSTRAFTALVISKKADGRAKQVQKKADRRAKQVQKN